MIDIHTLREDQAEVQRQLQPAAHEDEAGKRADGFGDLFLGILGHRHCDFGLYQIGASVPPAFYTATACAVCGYAPGIKARHYASDNVRNEKLLASILSSNFSFIKSGDKHGRHRIFKAGKPGL
jgi:hypothetical protein